MGTRTFFCWLIGAMVCCAVTSWGDCFSTVQPSAVATTHEADPARFDPRVLGLVTITHIGRDRWRFVYDLSRDAWSIFLGSKAEKYHATAWKLPDAFHVLVQGPYSYPERRDGKPFRQMAIDVRTYRPVVLYAPQPFAVFDKGTARQHRPAGLRGPDR